MWGNLLPAAVFSLLIALLAYQRAALSRSGVFGAVIVGTGIIGLGGWRWGVVLATFFVSSSLLSRFKEDQKRAATEKFAKGHRRDWWQTMANGGGALVVAVISAILPGQIWPAIFIGLLATVNADTWATELGTLATQPPKLLISGRPVPPGSSGGVTPFGTASALSGALVIGLTGGMVIKSLSWWQGALLGAPAGLFGALVDSFLGATVQGVYMCRVCGQETERLCHHGQPTRLLRGWHWLGNDAVNFFSSLAGGGVAAGIWLLLS